tara:strand:- start:1511 stop:1618 length:108 start_codon:yes stop_codon:yes gene_type:complete
MRVLMDSVLFALTRVERISVDTIDPTDHGCESSVL